MIIDDIKSRIDEKIDYYLNQNLVNKLEDKSVKDVNTTEFGQKKDYDDVIYDDITQLSTSFLKRNSIFNDTTELIRSYRKAGQFSYVHNAIIEIVNDAIVLDEEKTVELKFKDGISINDSIKEKIIKEFDYILDLLKFDNEGDVLFENWYIDGRIYLQKILDKTNTKRGIIEIKQMSPLELKRVYNVKEKKHYYIFAEEHNEHFRKTELKVPEELICYGHSGIINREMNVPVSNLHYALKYINRLDLLEDHILIYRIVRAPGRRAFYIDVGNLPQTQAKQYMQDIINKYRNKKVYNISSGKIEDSIDSFSMLEDYFLMRRNGKNTEVQELSEGANLGQIDDLMYFEGKVYEALQVPKNRMKKDSGIVVDFSKSAEVERDELKFARLIKKLRKRFSSIFFDLIKTQLYLKNIMNENEFNEIKSFIFFDFKNDSFYEQAKEIEKLKNQLEVLASADEYIGRYYSEKQIQKIVLNRSDDEIEQTRKEIEKEKNTPNTILYNKELEQMTALDQTGTDQTTNPSTNTMKKESINDIFNRFL